MIVVIDEYFKFYVFGNNGETSQEIGLTARNIISRINERKDINGKSIFMYEAGWMGIEELKKDFSDDDNFIGSCLSEWVYIDLYKKAYNKYLKLVSLK